MPKVALQIRANFENIERLYPKNNFVYLLKFKCTSCGESDNKWHDVVEKKTIPTKIGRSEVHYLSKCKMCSRENSMDIIKNTNGQYCEDEDFKTIIIFDCRGLEPIEFSPEGGEWIAISKGSGRKFTANIADGEWADYDEMTKQSVGIFDFESQFQIVK